MMYAVKKNPIKNVCKRVLVCLLALTLLCPALPAEKVYAAGGVYSISFGTSIMSHIAGSGLPPNNRSWVVKTDYANVYHIELRKGNKVVGSGTYVSVNDHVDITTSDTPDTAWVRASAPRVGIVETTIALGTGTYYEQVGVNEIRPYDLETGEYAEYHLTFKMNLHQHNWQYSASGNTVTARCTGSGSCPIGSQTISINPNPAEKAYNGQKTEATLTISSAWTTANGLVAPPANSNISYSPANSPNVGNYRASITVANRTAATDFRITRADIAPSVNLDDWIYGENPKSPTLAAGSNPGNGALSYRYKEKNAPETAYSTAVPLAAGNYTVEVIVAETSNYKSGSATDDFSILPKEVSVNVPAEDRAFDGTTDASLSISDATFDGLLDSDSGMVSVTSAKGQFADKNVGKDKAVTISDIVLGGSAAGNYTPVPTQSEASILPRNITVGGIKALDKTYDGNTDAQLQLDEVTLSGKLEGDELALASASGSFIDKNAGKDKAVQLSGFSLTGADKNNYALAQTGQQTEVRASIHPKEIGLTWDKTTRIYNGKEQKPEAHATGLLDGDSCEVIVDGAKKDAGNGYTAEAVALHNTNYKLPAEATASFDILPKEITKEMLAVSPDTMDASGVPKGPVISMTDREVPEPEMEHGKDYLTSGAVSGEEAGTHFVTIEGRGNYTGTLDTSWVLYHEKESTSREDGKDGAGKFEVFVLSDPKAPAISFDNFDVAYAKTLLDESEMERYLSGEDVQVYIQLSHLEEEDLSETDRSNIQSVFDSKSASAISWFDITLWKKIGIEKATNIKDTGGKTVSMKLTVPNDKQKVPTGYRRLFYVAHSHADSGQLLSESENIEVRFGSSVFSPYALGSRDVKDDAPGETINTGDTEVSEARNKKYTSGRDTSSPSTGDSMELYIYILLFALMMAFSIIVIDARRRPRNDK